MAEQNDMDTIAALLGNLIERVEKIEEVQAMMKQKNDKVFEVLGSMLETDKDFKVHLSDSITEIEERLGKLTTEINAGFRTVATESESAKRHGIVDEWTGDHSRQLSEMRVMLDQAINKKKGIFS